MTDRPQRILVVDDNVRDRKLVAAMLESLGYESELAAGGAEALKKLDGSIDLVLLDVQMPESSGFEVARSIRALPEWGDVPIILVTILNDRDDRIRGVTAGANDFISKPIDRTELRVRMGSLLEMKAARDGLRRARENLEREVRERTAELAASEQLYRALFENMTDGVAIYRAVENGDDFVFVDFNRAAEKITGVTRDEVLDRSVREVFPGVESLGLLEVLLEAWRSGDHRQLPIAKYRDGRIEIWTENSVSRLPSGEVVAVFSDETERKRTEVALKTSEEKYRGLVETAPIGILSVDTEGRILELNRKFLEIMGSPSAAETKAINMFTFPPLVDAGISAVFRGCIADGTGRTYETPYVSKWGKKSHLRMLLTSIQEESGDVQGCQAVVEDVTDRKKAEDELKENRLMLETILAAVPVGIHLAEGRKIQWANEAWRRMFGFENENQYAGKSSRILYPTESEFRFVGDILHDEIELGNIKAFDTRLRRLDGTTFDAAVRTAALDPSDVTKGIIEAITDVSERKRGQKALRESEEKYRATFDNAAVGIGLVDGLGRFLEVNEVLADFLGLTQDEIPGLSFFDLIHSEDVEISKEQYGALVRGDIESYRLETRYVRKDGKVVWGDISVSALKAADGEYRAAVGVIADITARRRSDEVRRVLAEAVEQAAETIMITDTKGTITYVNPAFERTTGYSRQEAVGMNPHVLKSGVHDDDFYRDMWRTITTGDVWSGHLTNKRKDGTLFEEEATISPIKDHSGTIVNYVGVKRDVTREVALQNQLIQAQKMEAIGTLAGGIAHDFNNLLQVTLGYSELLLAEKKERDSDYSDLMKIFQAAKSGSDLVRRLLTFSRGADSRPVPLDLNRQIVQVSKLLRRTIPRMIDIRLDLADDIARINADPTQVEQVLMNLAVNARDAMPEGGKLTIGTKNSILDAEFFRTRAAGRSGEYVLLTVSDTGHGMDRSIIERMYEPFFSTKELGRGTGLGLPMVYGIVKQHGGFVVCHSQPERGTTFEVYWPAIRGDEEATIDDVIELPRGGTETILLVDDEDFVRDLANRILSGAGYKVLTAGNGREAIDLFLKHGQEISLIILDMNMPVMGGKDCLKELLHIEPRVKVIIASGYSSGVLQIETGRLGAKAFVRKPFRVNHLLDLIRDVLDER